MPSRDQIRQLFAVHRSREAVEERALRAALFDRERRWVGTDGDKYRLSDRLWQQKKWIRTEIDNLLKQAIASGEDALVTATKLEQFLSPEFAPTRTERGRIVRGQRKAIVTEAPGRGGSGGMPARRLARTEISRAHSNGTMWSAARTPFAVGWKYNLSGSHPKQDPCDRAANADNGLGRGVYRVGEGPQPPIHPNCLCHVSIATVDDVDAVVDALKKAYDL